VIGTFPLPGSAAAACASDIGQVQDPARAQWTRQFSIYDESDAQTAG